MTMKLLEARRTGATFRYRIWIDTSKKLPDVLLPDGSPADPIPHPDFIIDETFVAEERNVAGGETAAAYTARLTAQAAIFRDLAKYHAVRILAEKTEDVLADEGAEL